MSVLTHLKRRASDALPNDAERQAVRQSITVLRQRLAAYFSDDIQKHFIFGSYERNTVLRRAMDPECDVDYMVVFADDDHRPQTYLDRLRRFVENYYSTSEIHQSHPTIKLDLNHMRFELVPAIHTWWRGLSIPGHASSYTRWIETDPDAFSQELVELNGRHSELLKPTIRLLKYWNATAGHVLESYGLEQQVAGGYYWSCTNLADYFFSALDRLSLPSGAAEWRLRRLEAAKDAGTRIQQWQHQGYETTAEQELVKLLP